MDEIPMQLVAYGAQDIYFTGNPQITFFKVVTAKDTPTSQWSPLNRSISGTPSFGGSSSITISSNGDLVGRVYVEFDASAVKNYHS